MLSKTKKELLMLLISERQSTYPLALLLSSGGKKTCAALGREFNQSGDSIIRLLEHNAVTTHELIEFAKSIFTNKEIYVVLDDTLIEKRYSKAVEGTSDNRDHSNGQVYRSLCSIVAMATDGKHGIAIDHELWASREIAQGNYKTKSELAQVLIESVIEKISIKMVIMDGLYATESLISWLNTKNIFFEMRFHANRRLTSDTEKSFIIRYCAELALKRRRSSATISAYWKGIPLFFTSVKRKTNHGNIILYQVSNYSTARHKLLYSYRWNIEMFFRTAKQHLGLGNCQSRKLKLQKNHLTNVFFAYALLQAKSIKQKLLNPETALHRFKRSICLQATTPLPAAYQIFHHFEAIYA